VRACVRASERACVRDAAPEIGHDGEFVGRGDEHVLDVEQLGDAQASGRPEGRVQILLPLTCAVPPYAYKPEAQRPVARTARSVSQHSFATCVGTDRQRAVK
jgi:hypothetical protein